MSPTLRELQIKLDKLAQEHHRASSLYFASLGKSSKETQKLAVDQYRSSAQMYLGAISLAEQYLLGVQRDAELEQELSKIQTLKNAVEVILKYL